MIRLTCLVPGCRRTRGRRKGDTVELNPDMRWICGQHWRGLDRADKAMHRKGFDQPDTPKGRVLRFNSREAWKRLEAAAIEKAAGL